MGNLTIATVTYNALDYTKFFLERLRKYSDIPYHLIIVDNHSTDGTAEFLAAQDNLEVVFNKRNLGFGQANNQAFKRTKTPYFLGLNNDTAIGPGFLSRIIHFAEKHPEYGEFGVHSNCIGAKNPHTGQEINTEIKTLTDQGIPPIRAAERYYENISDFSRKFAIENPGIIQMIVPPNFIGGWCFLVHTEAVKKAGGLFDRRFKVGFWEDVDLSWRLAKGGYMIGLIQELYLHHFNHVSFSHNKLRRSDKSVSKANAIRFAEKWSDEFREILNHYFSSGLTLEQIVKRFFIFEVLFRRADGEYGQLEQKIKREFLQKENINFRDFLVTKKKRIGENDSDSR